MPRTRKNANDNWMPPRVYRGPSYFRWQPATGGAVRLCGLDAKQSEVWQAYEKAVALEENRSDTNTLIQRFLSSPDFSELAPATQRDYLKYSKKIISVFGRMKPDSIEPKHVRRYMDLRGEKSKVQANREKAFFSRMFRWAYERGYVKSNPCKGVRQFKEVARDRYVSDAEYFAVYRNGCPAVRAAMQISYLCAARQQDVLSLRKDQILDDGIFIQQGKTGKKQIKLWSQELREAVKECDNAYGANSLYVIHQATGSSFTRDGFNSRWRKAREKARKETGLPLDFTFHDLKAKGISDYEGSAREKQIFSGHKTERQVATYDRKVEQVPSLNRRNITK